MPDAHTQKTANQIARDLTSLKLSPESRAAMERYLPYLDELRRKLFIVLIVFLIMAVIGALFYKQVLLFILGRFNLEGVNIVLTSPYQIIELAVQIGLLLGLLTALPLLIWYLIGFLRPALEHDEFKIIVSLLPLSLFLFIVGFMFGTTVMNAIIGIFTHATSELNLQNLWDVSRFFSQTMFMGMAMALAFQFPIILTLLLRLGFIEKPKLYTYRPVIYVAILLFAVIMPPTDIFSLFILTLPLFLLFELTLLLNRT
ncbi:hypothetical protein A2W24_02400 [Microgenomates group bacterium RBG_16_45_19]|nr:MAG: hypothetical protein A2W24_02400 [Microgenomates group bacterium RBG_16_45_19]